MKSFTIVLAGMLFAAIQATTNFKNTCSTVNNQMSSLGQYIGQVKAIAKLNGHVEISRKCDEASQHLVAARSSWNTISSSYGNFPWQARSSSQAGVCQSRLSSCGSCISWIQARPEIKAFPAYQAPVSRCWRGHNTCQSSCAQVWNWPSPPGYQPRPSGYRWSRRETTKAPCPRNETACPISSGALGLECIDTQSEITSCGGCATKSEGVNCLSIQGADEVGCEAGICRVFSVLPGYVLSTSNSLPVAL